MNRNTSPKAEFLKNAAFVKLHHEIIEHPGLQYGLQVTLLEMQRQAANNTPPGEFNSCAASHLRMLGAQDFIAMFLNLAETFEAAAKPASMNLPGNVSQMPRKN